MSLKEKIKKDLNQAVKEKKEPERLVLRGLLASLSSKEKDKRYNLSQKEGLEGEELEERSSLTDEEAQEAVFSEAKKRKEAIEECQKGGRDDLVEKEKKELAVLKKYLPEQISDEDLEEMVGKAIIDTGAETMKDMGKVMSQVMPQVKGKAEGSRVSQKAKEILSR